MKDKKDVSELRIFFYAPAEGRIRFVDIFESGIGIRVDHRSRTLLPWSWLDPSLDTAGEARRLTGICFIPPLFLRPSNP